MVFGGNTSGNSTGSTLIDSVSVSGNGTSGNNVVNIGGAANGNNSASLGTGSVSSEGGIALGSGSIATRNDELNIGDRQITSVKKGVENTDTINVSQLNDSFDDVLNLSSEYSDNSFPLSLKI